MMTPSLSFSVHNVCTWKNVGVCVCKRKWGWVKDSMPSDVFNGVIFNGKHNEILEHHLEWDRRTAYMWWTYNGCALYHILTTLLWSHSPRSPTHTHIDYLLLGCCSVKIDSVWIPRLKGFNGNLCLTKLQNFVWNYSHVAVKKKTTVSLLWKE